MAKLYRIVPNALASTMAKAYLTDIKEDMLYKLGYMSYDDHQMQYFGTYSARMMSESANDYVFFFDSPWSCFKCIDFFNSLYSDEVATILEYDIPEEIIKCFF